MAINQVVVVALNHVMTAMVVSNHAMTATVVSRLEMTAQALVATAAVVKTVAIAVITIT
jgi:hypothetical protein